ncbi:actin-related protein 2/3 complex subunit 5-like [Sycon ciliatum]|uniref:actin-related protein 2/3 complex subunit 5-like n=1 Tax=Sycon ciliatum TaxID=27933 RepID=UPI0020AD3C10
MSKNTGENKFRTVDVDDFDEDKFHDDNDGTDGGSVQPQIDEIKGFLQKGQNQDALKAALSNPPLAADKSSKDKYFQQTLNVLTAFRSSELDKAVASLSAIEVDVLMKYLYRAFSEPTEKSCAIILQWHEKAVAIGGLGSIVRTLTDRKTV